MALTAKHFNKIVVFGDSLSDAGYTNLTPRPAGKLATYSNGKVWPQYLSEMLLNQTTQANNRFPLKTSSYSYNSGTLNGYDFAAGGATTYGLGISFAPTHYHAPSLIQQITLYPKSHATYANDLYIVWIGANDLFRVYAKYRNNSLLMFFAMFPAANVSDSIIVSQIVRLHKIGAKHIIVIGVPNIGLTPLLNNNLIGQAMYYLIINHMNASLQRDLAHLNFYVKYIDANFILRQVIRAKNNTLTLAHHQFTFSSVIGTACIPEKSRRTLALYCRFRSGTARYLFADKIHPTTYGHQLIAIYLKQQILADKKL
jgi:outer membrane lipase/esterase